MVTNNSKIYLFRDSYTLRLVPVLNTLVRKSSDLPKFNQTHNAAMFSSKGRNICFIGTWNLVLLDILYVLMQVKPGTFLPIHRCAFSFLFALK